MTLAEIIAQMEAAAEGSLELDLAIHQALGWELIRFDPGDGDVIEYWRRGEDEIHADQRRSKYAYTQSLDAALTLIPEGWFIYGLMDERTPIVYRGDKHKHLCWTADLQHEDGGRLQSASAKTPALVLCIAALKARSAP